MIDILIKVAVTAAIPAAALLIKLWSDVKHLTRESELMRKDIDHERRMRSEHIERRLANIEKALVEIQTDIKHISQRPHNFEPLEK